MFETNYNLTRHELNILKWVALGKSDITIANLYGLSAQDVVNHVRNISEVLKASNRVELSLKAIKLGLV